MEALHSRLTTGEQSGGEEHCQPESPQRGLQPKSPSQQHQLQQTGSPKPHGAQQQPRQSRRQHPERKRLRPQRQSIDSDTLLDQKHEATKATTVSSLSPGTPPSVASGPNQPKPDTQEGTPKQKRERKPQRPGKYVCTYCGRACAKPSVLQKHIRSHTGERPYPCAPCGFSFKTKSNLYKHRKSHTHRVKAGLALGETRPLEEQITESEDETRQLSSVSSNTEGQGGVTSIKSHELDKAKDCTGGNDDSYAVKKRLALRLSRGKHGLRDSADEKTSSLILGSKGSTESGYFSRSESTEQSQDSPNTSAKSYAEIILGKYGRLGHLQRMSRHHNQQSSGQEDKSIPFTVPKKQVIDHITKLITINEAVVDTSKIDSVKPRRFSLSRKSSSESQKGSSVKEHVVQSPKPGDLGYKNSGSITMGVPCEKFHHQSLNVEQSSSQPSSAPLLRSHSMPSAPSSYDVSSSSAGKFRQSQSFDERQPSEMQASRRYGMLRRQPAIEIPLGAEFTKEEHESARSFFTDSITTVPDHKQSQPQPYECEACGTGCQDWEGYKKHKQSLCLVHRPRNEVVSSQMESSQLINHAARPGALAMRKRRKEESFDFDEPASPTLPSPCLLSGQSKVESNMGYECPRRPMQTCSVIQHTSSFEKQDSLCENQCSEATKHSPPHEEYQHVPQKQPQQATKLTTRKLVRQHSVQVPEILVTEDSNMSTEVMTEPNSTVKQSENQKSDEFQWPQRSSSLAQLPIEKLPPKKKRLRLAEAAQSSGESSFDSISLPRSPSQDSSASYASSRSTSFEESNRQDIETATSTPLRRSRAPQMLTVPGVHQHREMRRSASEQAPHDPQPNVLMAETRSKSFDYSCLSPERTAIGWRERRKCLLMRHSAVRDPDEEEEEQPPSLSRSPERMSSSPQTSSSSVYCGKPPSSPLCGETILRNPVTSKGKEVFSQWKLQNIQLTGSTELPLTHVPTNDPLKDEALESPPPEPQPYSTQGLSGAARAHYLPMSTGLKLEIPSSHDNHSEVRVSQSHMQHTVPHISSSVGLLRPVMSPAVAVRLQADTLPPACAIYTTLSQSSSPRPQEAFDAVPQNIPTAEYGNYRSVSPDLQTWSEEDLRLSGSGGNKRMLSPSNSIELSPESQQQQKRVKEEEEREVGCFDKASVDPCRQELKQETELCLPSVCSSVTHVGPSFPSLLSSTCNSWCYLNYIKPNPSALDEQKPSVYSSWSTSGYDPNPPGLSSKTALSLLHCKQRLSPSIYTTSPMSVRANELKEEENIKRPSSTEVYSSQSYCRDHDRARKGQQPADNNRSNKAEEEEEGKKTEEEEEEEEEWVEVRPCFRGKHPPEIWMSEQGSNEKYGVVHSGRGGKCQCEDKNTSMLQKDTHYSAEPPPYKCRHCNIAFKANESTTEHMTSKTVIEKTCCYPDDMHKGVSEKCSGLDRLKDFHYSRLGKGGYDEADDRKHEVIRSDEEKGPVAAQSSQVSSSDSELCGPLVEPERSLSTALPSKDSIQKSSASARRALFARRRLDPSVSTPSGNSPNSPSVPQRELSPPRSHSPTLGQSSAPLSCLSPSSCHVSTSPVRPVSPVRCLSPVIVQSPGVGSSGPQGSHANTSAQCQDCPHPKDQPSTARLEKVGTCQDQDLVADWTEAVSLFLSERQSNQHPHPGHGRYVPFPSMHEVGLTHTGPHPRPRGSHNILSHLPLHSQQPSRSPSLLIPIGGIHMIQPRSPLRLYSPTGTGTPWRAEGRFSPPQRQDIHKMSSVTTSAGPPDPGDTRETSGSSCSVELPHRKGHKPPSPRQPPSVGAEVRPSPLKVSTDVPLRCVYPERSQGQKKAPPSQTQL